MSDIKLIFLEPKDRFRPAILGIVWKTVNHPAICYSVDLVIKALMKHDNINNEDAHEWFVYNIESLQHYQGGPMFVYELDHYLDSLQ